MFSYNPGLPGVNNKVIDKIYSLKKVGLDIKGIVLYNEKELNLTHLPDELFEKHFYINKTYNNRLLKTKFLSFLNSAVQNFHSTKDIYKKYLSKKKIDFLILRYGTSDYSMKWLIKKLDGKIIFESNTNEVEQLKLRYKGLFKTPSWISYDYLNEKYLAPRILKKVAAVICVTDEIARYQKKRIGSGPKIITISNGINTESFPIAPVINIGSGEIKLLMICGGDVEWHGLDKIAPYLAKTNFKLYVVGKVTPKYSNENVVYTGELSLSEIADLINKEKVCCGVGSLAIERVGLKEAAPLKVREYLARGLPVIYSYNDTDIDRDPAFRDTYCIKLDYGFTQVNLEKITTKLKGITAIEDYNIKIREFALKNVDVNSKALQYKALLSTLNSN